MLVHYHLATTPDLPPITASLYEYVTGGNGVFKRARRDVMSATIPICDCRIRGLAPVMPELVTNFGKVPEAIINEILDVSREAARNDLEALFYLRVCTQTKVFC